MDVPPVGRALGKPNDWVCLNPSPEGTCCGQRADLREARDLATQPSSDRGSHSTIRHPPPGLQRGFPRVPRQTMLRLTVWEPRASRVQMSTSWSQGPGFWQAAFSRPAGSTGLSPGISSMSAPTCAFTARTHGVGHCGTAPSSTPSPSSHSGYLHRTQGPTAGFHHSLGTETLSGKLVNPQLVQRSSQLSTWGARPLPLRSPQK